MTACLASGCPEDVPKTEDDHSPSADSGDGGINDAGPTGGDHVAGPFHIRFAPEDGHVPYPMAGLLDAANLWRTSLPEMVQHLSFFAKQGEGFPTTQVLTLPVTEKPQMSTLTGNLLIMDAETEIAIDGEFTWHEPRAEIVFTPEQPFAPGTELQILLRGGTTGIRSGTGEILSAPALFHDCMIAQRQTEECTSFYPQAQEQWFLAQRFGLNANNLAFAYRVPITEHTEIQGSAYFSQGVFPDALHWAREDGHTTIPKWLVPDSIETVSEDVRADLETQTAFSLTGGLFVPFSNANNPLEVTEGNKSKLFFVDTTVTAHAGFERQYFSDEQLLYVRPSLTLEPSSTYVYRVTDLTDRGLPIVPQDRVAILTGPDVLNAEGNIQVPGLSSDKANQLAAAQIKVRPFVTQWQTDGVDPFSLSALGYFDTLSATDSLNARRDALFQQDLDLDFKNKTLDSPWNRGLWPLLNNVETVYTGEATLQSWLEPNSRRADDTLRQVQTEFVLTIPEDAEDPSNIPVVLFGHGINTSAELAYGVANFLADAGYAVFAIDLPYHGMRSICTSDAQCAGWGSTCRGDGQCINDDNSLGRVRKSPNLFSGGPQVAITTGTHFFEIDDIIATRDHFSQALLDQMQALRILQNADWVTLTGYGLKTEQVSYLGISLGSILGASLSPIEPDIQNFAFNVGGADVTRLLQNSTALSLVLADFLRQYDVEESDLAYTAYTYFARWMLDVIDPINFVQHTTQSPLNGIPAKNALIQMCDNDLVVPNITTQLLSERMGQSYESFSPLLSNHGFLVDPTSISGAAARSQIVDFFNQNP